MLVKVRSKVDDLTVIDRTLKKGETADCPADRAKYLVQRGLVEVVESAPGVKPKATPEAVKPSAHPVAPAIDAKGDVAERAVATAPNTAEHQVKKG
jgi:hypothetical protein